MDNSGFNDWDGFGSDDDIFGGSSSDNLNSGAFGDTDNSSDGFDFDEDSEFGSFSSNTTSGTTANQNSSADGDNEFSGAFDTMNQQVEDNGNAQQDTGVKKNSLIIIAAGVVVILAVIFIAPRVLNKSPNKNVDDIVQSEQPVNSNVNVDNIVNDNSSNDGTTSTTDNTVIYNTVDGDYKWTSISDHEDVTFDDDYKEQIFTITNIEHRARAVDTNNNLVVITTLHGSISGLSGTYEIDVPYNKGVKLVVGNSFTVHVQLGTYNNKTVVGEIKF